ncbi:hypothetical protein ABT282_07990 [Streptomyces sp. NPDC000927]|uniref:hypothetical protein n=1 Tax=Streptomyces sp. NPDC000927 TaxID=3154371 RepID=UPI0033223194
MDRVNEPAGPNELVHFDLGRRVNGDLFSPPAGPGDVPAFSEGDASRITPGFITDPDPGSDGPHHSQFRHVLRHKLDTLETYSRGRECGGLVVVAPVYAMPMGARPGASVPMEGALKYYRAIGKAVGWVIVDVLDGAAWVGGVASGDVSDRLASALPGKRVYADWRTGDDGRPVLVGLYVMVPAAVHPFATSMTKGDVIRVLSSGRFADLPDDTPVIIEKDAEGNGYSPLAGIERGVYVAESTWSGGIDEGDPDGVLSIILGPVN